MNKQNTYDDYVQVFGTNFYDIRTKYPMAFAIRVDRNGATGLVRKSDLPKQEKQAWTAFYFIIAIYKRKVLQTIVEMEELQRVYNFLTAVENEKNDLWLSLRHGGENN